MISNQKSIRDLFYQSLSKMSAKVNDSERKPKFSTKNNTEFYKREQLKYVLKEWILSSTSHGLPNLFRTRRTILKVIWAVSFLISSACCAFMVNRTISTYFEFDVVSKFSVMSEIPSVFPTVTICNIQPFTTNEGQSFVNHISKIYYLKNFSQMHNLDLQSEFYLWTFLLQSNAIILNKKERVKLGYTLNDMIISCYFATTKCTESDFEYFYSKIYGNCYKFNSGRNSSGHQIPLVSMSKTGKLMGLKLELFLGFNNNIGFIDKIKGAHIIISNQSLPISIYDGFDVPLGQETNVHLKRELINRLEAPYSECVTDNSLISSRYFEILNKNRNMYRQADCIDLCLQEFIIEHCKCFEPSLHNFSHNNPCITILGNYCQMGSYANFTNKEEVYFDNCLKLCPTECNSVIYSYTFSSSTYPSRAYAEQLAQLPAIKKKFPNKTEISYEEIKENILQVNVFYDDFKITVNEEVPKMGIEDLVSNIGGTLGLLIGVSLLSFVEIIEILVEILYVLFGRSNSIINSNIESQ
jgi:hypothetical protein